MSNPHLYLAATLQIGRRTLTRFRPVVLTPFGCHPPPSAYSFTEFPAEQPTSSVPSLSRGIQPQFLDWSTSPRSSAYLPLTLPSHMVIHSRPPWFIHLSHFLSSSDPSHGPRINWPTRFRHVPPSAIHLLTLLFIYPAPLLLIALPGEYRHASPPNVVSRRHISD